MPSGTCTFEHLEHAAGRIATHPDGSGTEEAVADCLDDIDARWGRGELSLDRRLRLYALFVRAATTARSRRQVAG